MRGPLRDEITLRHSKTQHLPSLRPSFLSLAYGPRLGETLTWKSDDGVMELSRELDEMGRWLVQMLCIVHIEDVFPMFMRLWGC